MFRTFFLRPGYVRPIVQFPFQAIYQLSDNLHIHIASSNFQNAVPQQPNSSDKESTLQYRGAHFLSLSGLAHSDWHHTHNL